MTTIVRPNAATVFANATPVGAASAWEAIDDVVIQPAVPDTDDYIHGTALIEITVPISLDNNPLVTGIYPYMYANLPTGDTGATAFYLVTTEGEIALDGESWETDGYLWATSQLHTVSVDGAIIQGVRCTLANSIPDNDMRIAAFYVELQTTTPSSVSNYIRLHLQPDADPALTEAEFLAIVGLAAIADPDGLPPTDDDWTPTYDVTAAISQGWEVKAAKVAGAYRFKDTGLELHRDQVHEMCLKQAALWRSRSAGADGSGTIRVTSDAVEAALEDIESEEEILD